MKKYLMYSALSVAALALAGTGVVYAFGGEIPEGVAQRAEKMFQVKAELLGMDVEDVKDAWAQGKNMKEMAEEQGVDWEALHAQMQEKGRERMQERVQAMVDDGVISQEQAQQRLEFMQNNQFRGGFHRCPRFLEN